CPDSEVLRIHRTRARWWSIATTRVPHVTPAELRALRHRLRVRPRRRLLVPRRVFSPSHAGARLGAGLPLSDLPAGGSRGRPHPLIPTRAVNARSSGRARRGAG